MFDSNPEPTATQSVTVTLRAKHGNLTGANIEYCDSADGSSHCVLMRVSSTDPTGAFD
jgi:alpha-glucosidase